MKHPKQKLMDKVLHLKPTPAAVAAKAQPIVTVTGHSSTMAAMETAPVHPLFDTTPNGLITTPTDLINQRAAAMGLEVTWHNEFMGVSDQEHEVIGTSYAQALNSMIESFAKPHDTMIVVDSLAEFEPTPRDAVAHAFKVKSTNWDPADPVLQLVIKDGEPCPAPSFAYIRDQMSGLEPLFDMTSFGARGVGAGEGLVIFDVPKPRGREPIIKYKRDGSGLGSNGTTWAFIGGSGDLSLIHI